MEIGANSCIDRGSIGRTVDRQSHTKIDNLVHLAHNVQVGRGVFLAAARPRWPGPPEIGDGVMTGGQVGITGHVEVGAGARIGGAGRGDRGYPSGANRVGFSGTGQPRIPPGHGDGVQASGNRSDGCEEVEERLAALEESAEG